MKPDLLFVDDDDLFIAAVYPYLKTQYRITIAHGAAQARALLARRSFALIFTDLWMVDASGRSSPDEGFRVIEMARSQAANRETRIILTTNALTPELEARLAACSGVTCVAKDGQGARFLEHVRRLVDESVTGG